MDRVPKPASRWPCREEFRQAHRTGSGLIYFSGPTAHGLSIHIFIQEIDELVDEWQPEPLVAPMTAEQIADLAKVPVIQGANGPRPKLVNNNGRTVLNLASLNFTGLAGNEHIKQRAIETLRKYGLGSCGPPGFYGTIGGCTLTLAPYPSDCLVSRRPCST